MVSLEEVLAAREAAAGRLHRTPLFRSRTLGEHTGANVHLKAELFQKTGSFKPRGVLANLAALTPEQRERGVISISAGNHAQALAWGAAAEGLDALLVMWHGASEAKIAATRGYGATVDLESRDPAEAFARLADLEAESGRTLVHPFDHPLTIAGQGTVGLEVVEDLPETTTLIVPVGGGGLISGIAVAAQGRRVVGVEPELSPAMHDALAAGAPVRVEPCSIADGLALRRHPRPRDLPRAGRGDRPRLRDRARGRLPLPLRPRQARLRARGGGRRGSAPGRQGRAGTGRNSGCDRLGRQRGHPDRRCYPG